MWRKHDARCPKKVRLRSASLSGWHYAMRALISEVAADELFFLTIVTKATQKTVETFSTVPQSERDKTLS